jgi:hypothetical protein
VTGLEKLESPLLIKDNISNRDLFDEEVIKVIKNILSLSKINTEWFFFSVNDYCNFYNKENIEKIINIFSVLIENNYLEKNGIKYNVTEKFTKIFYKNKYKINLKGYELNKEEHDILMKLISSFLNDKKYIGLELEENISFILLKKGCVYFDNEKKLFFITPSLKELILENVQKD